MIKMLFRYMLKHKVNTIALCFFNILSIFIFSSLLMASDNLKNSYNHLVDNGNLNNGVIYELYSPTVLEDDKNTPNFDETTLEGDQAKLYNKKKFREELSNMIGRENWREFNSIDYNATTSGMIYKLVQTDYEYTIDKVVMYDGNNVLDVEYDFAKIIATANWKNDSEAAKNNRLLLLWLITRAKFSGSNYQNQFKSIFNICVNKDNGNLQDPKSVIESKKYPTSDEKAASYFKSFLSPGEKDYQELRNKLYRLSFSIPDPTQPESFNFDNFSSYSVILPEYVLEKQNKKILPQNLYNEYLTFANVKSQKTQSEFEDWLVSVPNEYKIKIDNSELIIIGNGMSPSFMYPVYDFEHIVPNTETEILAYGNEGAYGLLLDANRSSPQDNYLIFKVKDDKLKEVINAINILSAKYMSWPDNIKACYSMEDESNIFSPLAVRVTFLPNLVDLQVSLSTILSLFIGILTGVIFIFTIRKFISDNRNSIAILRANGFKKRWLIWIMPLFGLIPSLAGWIGGYITAQFTQSAMLSLFSNFWVIPTSLSIISPLLLTFTLLVPFGLMAILSVIFTWLTLRKNTRELMTESSRFKVTNLGKMANTLMTKASSITKFKASISFSSISKLVAITGLFTIMSVAMSFATPLIGKFDYVKSATFDNKKYNYALDFITPTVQGGGYVAQSFKDAGKMTVNNENEPVLFNAAAVDSNYEKLRGQNKKDKLLYNSDLTINKNISNNLVPLDNGTGNVQLTNVGDYSLSHLPSVSDGAWQGSQTSYLKYRMETPLLVDTKIGIGTNPWNIARSLMPSNSISKSNEMTKQFWMTALKDEMNTYFTEESLAQYDKILNKNQKQKLLSQPLNKIITENFNFIKKVTNEAELEGINIYDKYYLDKDYGEVKQGWYCLNRDAYKGLFTLNDVYTIIVNTLISDDKYQDYIYKVLYNMAILEKDEETYTKADVDVKSLDDTITLFGIKPDSQFIDLVNGDGEDVKYKLKLENEVEDKHKNNIHDIYSPENMDNQNNYNLIINQSAAYKYNLSKGDELLVDPIDEATRMNPHEVSENKLTVDFSEFNNKKYTFKIVDIIDTYQNPEFYINQRIANHINNMDLAPILKTSFYTTYNYDEKLKKDTSFTTLAIDPWNGIFSRHESNRNVSVNQVLYSPSGIAPAADKISINKSTIEVVKKTLASPSKDLSSAKEQGDFMSKMDIARALGYVDNVTLEVNKEMMNEFEKHYNISGVTNEANISDDVAIKIINQLIDVYSDSPLLSSVDNVEYVKMFIQIFDNTSSFMNNVLILLFVVIFVIGTLAIAMLTMDFIGSSMGLCAILKSLGISDATNAFSLLSMFLPAAILGLVISIPLSILLNNTMMNVIYGFSSILLPISYQWWTFFVASGLVMLIVFLIIGLSILVLKKQNLTKVISGF